MIIQKVKGYLYSAVAKESLAKSDKRMQSGVLTNRNVAKEWMNFVEKEDNGRERERETLDIQTASVRSQRLALG